MPRKTLKHQTNCTSQPTFQNRCGESALSWDDQWLPAPRLIASNRISIVPAHTETNAAFEYSTTLTDTLDKFQNSTFAGAPMLMPVSLLDRRRNLILMAANTSDKPASIVKLNATRKVSAITRSSFPKRFINLKDSWLQRKKNTPNIGHTFSRSKSAIGHNKLRCPSRS